MAYTIAVLFNALIASVMLIFIVVGQVQSAAYAMMVGQSPLELAINLLAVTPAIALWGVPMFFALNRWRFGRGSGERLLPALYRADSPLGYRFGIGFAWLGHIVVAVSIAIGVLSIATHSSEGVPWGIGVGFGANCYMAAMLCIEFSIRGWNRKGAT